MADTDIIGEIRLFPYTFVPKEWISCDGQVLQVSQNTALAAVLGKTWGGDGSTTFALPNLNGRAAMHPSTSYPDPGAIVGSETVQLQPQHMPAHGHTLQRKQVVTPSDKTAGPLPTSQFAQIHVFKPDGSVAIASHLKSNGTPDTTLHYSAIGIAGGNQPHSNVQPRLSLIFAICAYGMFPEFD